MSPLEVIMWIEGFDYRVDLQGEMMAHFAASHMQFIRQKGQKKVRARDLWKRRGGQRSASRARADKAAEAARTRAALAKTIEEHGPQVAPVDLTRLRNGGRKMPPEEPNGDGAGRPVTRIGRKLDTSDR